MRKEPAVAERVSGELQLIRRNVPGVRGSITATSDGLLLAHDVHHLEPTQIAALVAAMHAVAVRATQSTGCGQFREVITRGSEGYLAVYAAGSAAVVAVLGTADLNVAMLNFQARELIERIAEHSAALLVSPPQGSAGGPLPRGETGGEYAAPLPVRRPPAG